MCSSLFFILPLLFCRHPIPLNSDLSELKGKVGNGMKCAKRGVVTFTNGQDAKVTINISSLNLDSVEDYMVITNGDGYDYQGSAYNGTIGYVDNQTATSFNICTTGYISALPFKVSYQVITFK